MSLSLALWRGSQESIVSPKSPPHESRSPWRSWKASWCLEGVESSLGHPIFQPPEVAAAFYLHREPRDTAASQSSDPLWHASWELCV